MKVNDNTKALEIIVDRLTQEANELLSETINATKEADDRAKNHGTNWTDRHRLHVLLEALEETRKGLPGVVVAPWFLAELMATLDVVREWRNKSCWKEIEPSLKSPHDFKHTILNLHVAEHLKGEGHKVEIIPTGDRATPDLMLHAIGGTHDLVRVECYQPDALCGKPSDISTKEAEKIVKTSMGKAKRQLGHKTPGILAICGYNQSRKNLEILKRAIESRLQKTSRSNLGGIWLITLGVRLHRGKEYMSFNATRSAKFIHNPSYFGKVNIEVRIPDDHPQLIKEPLVDIRTDSLESGDINMMTNLLTANNLGKIPKNKAKSRITKTRKLNIIEKPKKMSRTIVHGVDNKIPPIFKGEGNINYLCDQCETILAKYVWEPSISNIVVECPNCQSYNEFPLLRDSGYEKLRLTKGNYNFSGAVKLKRGICIEGQ